MANVQLVCEGIRPAGVSNRTFQLAFYCKVQFQSKVLFYFKESFTAKCKKIGEKSSLTWHCRVPYQSAKLNFSAAFSGSSKCTLCVMMQITLLALIALLVHIVQSILLAQSAIKCSFGAKCSFRAKCTDCYSLYINAQMDKRLSISKT